MGKFTQEQWDAALLMGLAAFLESITYLWDENGDFLFPEEDDPDIKDAILKMYADETCIEPYDPSRWHK